jgi:hypothetical protein
MRKEINRWAFVSSPAQFATNPVTRIFTLRHMSVGRRLTVDRFGAFGFVLKRTKP